MSKFIGDVSAYAYAVSKGYTGTEEEFAELMASYADVGQTAVDAKDAAVAAKTAAQTAATTATAKASEATTAATTATTKAGEASTSASTATSAKDTAVSASQTATAKATEATTAAATATSAATTATTAKDDAVSAKTAAQTAQTGAETAAASVSASAAQIQTNADDISELKEDLTQTDLLNHPINTVTADAIDIVDAIDANALSLKVNIPVTQSGDGTPSVNNVRSFTSFSDVTVDTVDSGNANLLNIENDTLTFPVGEDTLKTIVSSITLSAGAYTLQRNQLDSISSSTRNTFLVYEVGGGALFSSDTTTGNDAGVHYLTFTLSESKSIKIYLWVHTPSKELLVNNIKLETGSTPTPYRSYDYAPLKSTLSAAIYGGSIEMITGEGKSNYGQITFDGSETWSLSASGLRFVNAAIRDYVKKNDYGYPVGAYCDKLLEVTPSMTYTGKVGFSIDEHGTIAVCPTGNVMTVEEFTTWLSSNNISIVYPLKTEVDITGTTNTVPMTDGDNHFETSTGTVTVRYRANQRSNTSSVSVSAITKSLFVVDATGKGDFTTIQDAIDACTDIDLSQELTGTHCTILVMPGTYPRFSMGGGYNSRIPLRSISIIGVDRKTCIVRDDTGLYVCPPAEIRTNGTIANLTFYATHDDGDEDTTLSKDQYAVHIDYGTCDVAFENCEFISYSNCAVGMGLAENMKASFTDCHFENRGNGTWGMLTNGAFYCHTKPSADVVGQVLTLKNCEAICENGTIGALFQVLSTGSSEMELNLYNNMFWSGSGATANVQSGWDTDKSFGNNITLS